MWSGGGSGSTTDWQLLILGNTNQWSVVPGSFKNGKTHVFTGNDPVYLKPLQSGLHVAVAKKSRYCTNRMFKVQKPPTATASHSHQAQPYAEINTHIQYFSSGWIDSWAVNQQLIFNWNFDDGNTIIQQNPHHAFSKAGTYHVTLQTHDGTYNSETKWLPIWIRGPAQPPSYITYDFMGCSSAN